MRTLGLIGGTSWHSTVTYYKEINRLVEESLQRPDNPPLILHSLNVALMREGDNQKIKKKYLEVGLKLQEAGAEAILICANTPHLVYEDVQPKLQIPILHIADATGEEAKRRKFSKLGLLGTLPTMQEDFIRKRLQHNYTIETLLLDPSFRQLCHDFIAQELTRGIFLDKARIFFKNQISLLKNRGAEGIILGCTELPELLKDSDFSTNLLSTTDLHIQKGVDFILGRDE